MSKKIYMREKSSRRRVKETPKVTEINAEAAHNHAEGKDDLAKPPDEVLLPPDRHWLTGDPLQKQ